MLATLPGAKMPASPKCSEKWVSISSVRRANDDHSSLLFAGVADPRPDSPHRPPAPPTLSEILWETVRPHRDRFPSARSKAELREVAAPVVPVARTRSRSPRLVSSPEPPRRTVILPVAD